MIKEEKRTDGVKIKIDTSEEAIAGLQPGLKSGDPLICTGCSNIKRCGSGVIVGVADDPHGNLVIWAKLDTNGGKVNYCTARCFAQVPPLKSE